MKVIQSFGPTIVKDTTLKEIVDDLNKYADDAIKNELKSKKLNYVKKNSF